MFKILHDAENEVSILLGGPDKMVADWTAVEPGVSKAADEFLRLIGVDPAGAPDHAKQVAFDLLDKALEAMQHGEEADTGATPAGGGVPGAPIQPAPPAGLTEPEKAPVSEDAAKAQETADALSARQAPGAEQAAPAGETGGRVVSPSAGHAVCPTCDGWKTIVGSGDAVVPCPTCDGQGQVPTHQEAPQAGQGA